MKPEVDAAEEEKKAEETVKKATELESALKKGNLVVGTEKNERDSMDNVLNTLKKEKKGGKFTKKVIVESEQPSGVPDFATIKKFSTLKLIAPTKQEDFEKTLKDLGQLRDALCYWGNIMHRLNKIKFIQNSKRLQELEEYTNMEKDE